MSQTISSNSVEPAMEHNIGKGPMLSRLPAFPGTQDLLANFTDALVVLNENWRIEYANPKAAEICRKTSEQIQGMAPWDLWPAATRTEVERLHRTALNDQLPVELENPHADDAGKWLELRAFRCELGIVGYYHDFTEQKKASELQERLAAIVESSDDAIISKDLSGIIRTWNGGAERIFGYKADEIIGKHISTLAAAESIDEIAGTLQRITRGERVDHYQTKRKRKDGKILTVSLTVSPVRDASGKVVGASKVARDITEREQQAEALRNANLALTRSNSDLQQFAYSASHDLQEPLRMVATYSEMLQRKFGGQLGAAADEYIGYTIQGAVRMGQLLEDLRTYTQASTMEEEPSEDIDADQVLHKALRNIEAAVLESGACITSTPLPRVRMHEIQLQQLFQNLIGNAIRYRSSAAPKIHVAAQRKGQEWQFSIQDNGIGIDPQYKEQVFGIFKRLHSTSEYPGTGMGLAICQRIVERARGRIWVESQLGQGSTFYFTIPAGEA